MKKTLILSLISILCGILLVAFIPKHKVINVSGIIPSMDKRELVNNSTTIIKGIVKEILPSYWSNPDFTKGVNVSNVIQTDILIQVTDVYKNKPYADVITVRIDKGTVDGTTMNSEGYPDFSIGENVILFLSEDDGDLANTEEEYYVLTGMTQGKFTLVGNYSTSDVYKNVLTEHSYKDFFNSSTIQNEIDSILADLQKNPINKLTPEEISKQNEKLFGK